MVKKTKRHPAAGKCLTAIGRVLSGPQHNTLLSASLLLVTINTAAACCKGSTSRDLIPFTGARGNA